MAMEPPRTEIRERLRGDRIGRGAAEAVLTALGWLCPGGGARNEVRRRLAQDVYGCREDEVFLYKSGRAALRGLMEGLKSADPARRTAFVPYYVCNVVGAACRAAGFAVAGRRRGYYRLADGSAVDALVMAKSLDAQPQGS